MKCNGQSQTQAPFYIYILNLCTKLNFPKNLWVKDQKKEKVNSILYMQKLIFSLFVKEGVDFFRAITRSKTRSSERHRPRATLEFPVVIFLGNIGVSRFIQIKRWSWCFNLHRHVFDSILRKLESHHEVKWI